MLVGSPRDGARPERSNDGCTAGKEFCVRVLSRFRLAETRGTTGSDRTARRRRDQLVADMLDLTVTGNDERPTVGQQDRPMLETIPHVTDPQTVEGVLDGAGFDWPTAAQTHGWVIRFRYAEFVRDQVVVGATVYYRVEVTGRWQRQRSSDVGASELHRDYRLGYLAEIGARWLADHPAPGGNDE